MAPMIIKSIYLFEILLEFIYIIIGETERNLN